LRASGNLQFVILSAATNLGETLRSAQSDTTPNHREDRREFPDTLEYF